MGLKHGLNLRPVFKTLAGRALKPSRTVGRNNLQITVMNDRVSYNQSVTKLLRREIERIVTMSL
jgi:septum formation topological specificity factor MinE